MGVIEFVEDVTCPRCRARPGRRCVSGEELPRQFPHWRRALFAVGRKIATSGLERDDAVSTAVLLHDVDPRDSWSRVRSPASSDGASLSDATGVLALGTAVHFSRLLNDVLTAVDRHPLELSEIRYETREMTLRLEKIAERARLLHYGHVSPPAGHRAEWAPTAEEVQSWQEHQELERLRDQMGRREEELERLFPDRAAEEWSVDGPWANGVFRARRGDGFTIAGWVETPEATAEALRPWSTPAGCPVDIYFTEPVARPPRRLPMLGWLPDHPANQPELEDLHAHRNGDREQWQAQWPATRQSFRRALEQVHRTWAGRDITEGLRQAAERLNRDEPLAPRLGDLIYGGKCDLSAGITATTAWVDPAAVAFTPTTRWNAFGSHRPEIPVLITRRLLSTDDPDAAAMDVWSFVTEPIDLVRVPGPDGPLYHLGVNGQHRIHTARMLGFPMLWAVVTQHATPPTISWIDVDLPERRSQRDDLDTIISCWQGLIATGLVHGELDARKGLLRPVHIAAPWLLAFPAIAAAWARNYERAYPGSLTRLGIPAGAILDAHHWRSWLAEHAAAHPHHTDLPF